MKRNDRHRFSQKCSIECLWKSVTLVVVVAGLVFAMMGCTLDGVLSPFSTGDIPFDELPTEPTDMGVVDNVPTVPDDDFFDGIDFRPL